MDLLAGRAGLVPTFEAAAAGTCAGHLVASALRDMGRPDALVPDRDAPFFAGAFRTGLRAAPGAALVLGSPHRRHAAGKVERAIADVVRSLAGERAGGWPAPVPPVECAIDDSASPLGSGYATVNVMIDTELARLSAAFVAPRVRLRALVRRPPPAPPPPSSPLRRP